MSIQANIAWNDVNDLILFSLPILLCGVISSRTCHTLYLIVNLRNRNKEKDDNWVQLKNVER